MDVESLLTGSKWEIIEQISNHYMSPSELANRMNTTIANISQQLRLLETAGLVKKKKTGYGKPGKPRTLFSLSDDYALVIVFSEGYTQKKLIKISKKEEQVLKNMLRDHK